MAATGRYSCRSAHIDASAIPFPEKFWQLGRVPFPDRCDPPVPPPLFHRERSVETARLMTPITERLSARATTATERVRFALGCGHVVAVTVAQGNLPIYP